MDIREVEGKEVMDRDDKPPPIEDRQVVVRKVHEANPGPGQHAGELDLLGEPIGRGVHGDQPGRSADQRSSQRRVLPLDDDRQPTAQEAGEGWEEASDIAPDTQRPD